MKEVLKIEKNGELGITQITIRVPGFRNFGERLGELEKKAFETPTDVRELVGEIDASTSEMLKMMDLSLKEMEKKIAAMPEGMNKQVMRGVLQTMKFAEENDDDGDNESAVETQSEDSSEHDLQQLQVFLAKNMKWSKSTEARIDKFIEEWRRLRPAVLNATFRYYKEMYTQWVRIWGKPSSAQSKFTMPKPSIPKRVEDLFCITTIYVHKNGNIGLSGNCTWDDEHGYGALIKNSQVVSVGHSDEAFD